MASFVWKSWSPALFLGLLPNAVIVLVDIRCPPEDSLPRDSAIIESTRARIREVYEKLMDTQEKRTVSLLRAAALWKRNWKELEKGTLRMLADAAVQGLS